MAKYTTRDMNAYINIRGKVIGSRVSLAITTGIVFVILKLAGAINWQWLWVLSPFWGSVAYVVLSIAGIAIFAAVNTP